MDQDKRPRLKPSTAARASLIPLLLGAVACSDLGPDRSPDTIAAGDVGVDARIDAPVGADARADVGADAGADTSADAATDATSLPKCDSSKFLNLYTIKIGGSSLPNTVAAAQQLAKFDLVWARTMESDDLGDPPGSSNRYRGSSWKAIRSYSPDTKIYVHTNLCQVDVRYDCTTNPDMFYINNPNRFSNACGHSMGKSSAISSLWYHDSEGALIQGHNANWRLFNPGASALLDYVQEAWQTDHIGKPWTADGFATDGCCSSPSSCGVGIPGMSDFKAVEVNSLAQSPTSRMICRRSPTWIA